MADKLDITMMIERNYNILSSFENKIQAFFESYKNVDTKIVEKETAFINAKQELKLFMQEYKQILETTREEFKTELAKEQKQFIELANSNTKEVLNARKEELTEIMEQEEQKVLLKTEKVITILESFQNNINSKIADILKDLPNASENYINNAILNIGSTLKTNVEEYKATLVQELKKYKADVIQDVENSNIELKKSTKEIKAVAENIKKDSDNINRYSNYINDDCHRLNNNLGRINKGTVKLNYILSGINNSSVLKKIYILLFSIINVFFILRIIVPTTYKINFKSQLTMNIIIIAGAILIILTILDLAYSIFLYFFGEEIKEDED
jgi:hypothetical protein